MLPKNSPASSDAHRYWRLNLYVLGALLPVWFIVSFGLSIVWVEPLNKISLGGFPLGFWISQQGAIFVFVLLILLYAWLMGRVDRKYQASRRSPERAEGDQ